MEESGDEKNKDLPRQTCAKQQKHQPPATSHQMESVSHAILKSTHVSNERVHVNLMLHV